MVMSIANCRLPKVRHFLSESTHLKRSWSVGIPKHFSLPRRLPTLCLNRLSLYEIISSFQDIAVSSTNLQQRFSFPDTVTGDAGVPKPFFH